MALHSTPELPPSRAPLSGRSSSTSFTMDRADRALIPGWGTDLDHQNRPAYPKERTPPRLEGLHWDRPEDQRVRETIFHSTERPGLTPIFGTSAPPSGLSGRIRAWAYQLSENDVRHWLLLLFADRINILEGLLQDLARGHVPNIFSEMGIKAEWKYNRAGLVKKALIASTLAAGAYHLRRSRRAVHLGGPTRYRSISFADDNQRLDRKRSNAVGSALLMAAAAGAALYLFTRRPLH